jgi:O-acetyl-ADP-ribose deacetylase (regulator of RNase III)
MIELIQNGDIFEDPSEMIVNPVNMAGAMGKGLAKAFRDKYEGIWSPYYEKCTEGWKYGDVLTLSNPSGENPLWIVCYPTKTHWRKDSNMDLIKTSMGGLFDEIAFTGIKSLSIPALGAGLGNIPWETVKRFLLSCPFPEFVHVKIFEPL